MPHKAVLPAVIAAFVLAGCSADDEPATPVPAPVSPSGASAASASSAASANAAGEPAQADEPPGTITCARLAVAVTGATLMNPGVVEEIARTSATADAPVADAAQRLATAYADAVAATGTSMEPDAVAAVSAAAADMSGVCADSGLQTVG